MYFGELLIIHQFRKKLALKNAYGRTCDTLSFALIIRLYQIFVCLNFVVLIRVPTKISVYARAV